MTLANHRAAPVARPDGLIRATVLRSGPRTSSDWALPARIDAGRPAGDSVFCVARSAIVIAGDYHLCRFAPKLRLMTTRTICAAAAVTLPAISVAHGADPRFFMQWHPLHVWNPMAAFQRGIKAGMQAARRGA